jgi:4-azaleucine resistance transporter AzlC
MNRSASFPRLFTQALRYSFPVLLGYVSTGIAFGLLLVDAGYPWWLSPVMSVLMFAGAGQFIGVGLFAAGAGFWEGALVQLVVNARHIAYGLSLLTRFRGAGRYTPYLIYALSDETYALLSSLPAEGSPGENPAGRVPAGDRPRFMFLIALLDQSYWVAGTLAGAAAGTLIPFNMEGIGFALTALFIVLMIEQILRVRRLLPFLISALAAVLAALVLPARLSLLSAMALSLALVRLLEGGAASQAGKPPGGPGC